MSDYGDYRAWLKEVGLSLANDEPDDLTSFDYPDYDAVPQESAHAAEIPFDVDEDTDPTAVLRCARCQQRYEACRCARGPVRWPEAVDAFEVLHPKDADQ